MAKGIQTAGEFIIEELKLVTTSGLKVDLTTSVIGLTLYEGTTQIQKLIIGRSLLGLDAFGSA